MVNRDPRPQAFFESLSAVARRVRAVAAESYATFDVGSAQAKLLRHIGENARISQADLARATGTAPTLTGRAVETLMKRGWVRRTRSRDDRREYVLELTAAGRRMRARVVAAREKIAVRVAGALDARDVRDFERIAQKILTELDATTPRPPP